MFRKIKYLSLILLFAQSLWPMEECEKDANNVFREKGEESELSVFEKLPPEMIVKILTSPSSIEDILKTINRFANLNNYCRNFVKEWLPELLKKLIDVEKSITIKDFLSLGCHSNITLQVFKEYSRNKKADEEIKNIIFLFIEKIVKDIENKQLNIIKDEKAFINNTLKLNLLSIQVIADMLSNATNRHYLIETLANAKIDLNSIDEKGLTNLMKAARNGESNIVKTLINHKVNVNTKGANDCTALMYAAEGGYIGILDMLIKAKSDLNAQDKYGWTALRFALSKRHNNIVQMLIDANADVNIASKNDFTLLMKASEIGSFEIIQMLINAGANINSQNEEEYTALMYAAKKGFVDIVKMLIQAGADLSLKNKDGKNAAALAAENGHFDITQLIVNGRSNIEQI